MKAESSRRSVLAIGVLLGVGSSTPARADLLNHDRLRSHVASLELGTSTRADLDTSRVAFVLTALVPGWGTYRLEKRVFGGLRPAAIGDWVFGGLLPAGLAIAAYATDDSSTRTALAWSAIGSYAVSRLAILVIGNLHISEYRRALDLRFAAAPNTVGFAVHW